MITISQCRIQCNLLEDEVEYDPWFKQTIPAAVAFLSNTINRKIYESEDSLLADVNAPESAMVITDDLKLALLMLIGHWFLNRESTSAINLNEVPMGFEEITNPYRIINL
ncbi:head-tail connector protein [Glaciecola sp. 2405UD65-10]|uniref:head-tail connector protein n=1 Tax=Glaciecola sp. 2405UD65-10 TaxID=3397244 RepID=UPI003B59D858